MPRTSFSAMKRKYENILNYLLRFGGLRSVCNLSLRRLASAKKLSSLICAVQLCHYDWQEEDVMLLLIIITITTIAVSLLLRIKILAMHELVYFVLIIKYHIQCTFMKS